MATEYFYIYSFINNDILHTSSRGAKRSPALSRCQGMDNTRVALIIPNNQRRPTQPPRSGRGGGAPHVTTRLRRFTTSDTPPLQHRPHPPNQTRPPGEGGGRKGRKAEGSSRQSHTKRIEPFFFCAKTRQPHVITRVSGTKSSATPNTHYAGAVPLCFCFE
jgi:hypothetical protein